MSIRRVAWFGMYDPGYSRNRILLQGMRALGIQVDEYRVDPRQVKGIARWKTLVRLAWQMRRTHPDAVVVGFPAHSVAWLARLCCGRRVLVDVFVSLYNSNVEDRGRYGARSRFAWKDWVLDWITVHVAPVILLDTDAHIAYFERVFGVDPRRCVRIPIGAEDGLFFPSTAPLRTDPPLQVLFHGSFIPLQGVETIVRAAALLKDDPSVAFTFIGTGQEYARMQALAQEHACTNITWLGRVPYEPTPDAKHVAAYVREADVVLGIFGVTVKTRLVIPNKVYEGIASGKPVITADSPALREWFTDDRALLRVPPGDPEALANAVRALRDPARRSALGEAARAVFVEHFSTEQLGKLLRDTMESRLRS